MREITIKISDENFKHLKKAIKDKSASKIVNKALKQFFQKNHKMKVKALLKRGYKTFGELNLRLSRVLQEDADF